MRLFLLTTLTMVAFAMNSLLNRAALPDGLIAPAAYSALRVAAGVAALMLLLSLRDRGLPRLRWPDPVAALALASYMLGFSFAYASMDAGIGALVLFGGVQVTMFGGGILAGDRPAANRWAGMLVSFSGLAALAWPGAAVSVPTSSFVMMACAAAGWGVYSLSGRKARDPLNATAWNFAYTLPLTLLVLAAVPGTTQATSKGVMLAILSGAVTSGMGYALWYHILPGLRSSTAALAQLSVPVIAIALGAAFLEETLTLRAILSSILVLGGIAIGLLRFAKP